MMETFEHPSDIGVRGIGRNVQEAFAETARCMFSIIADPRGFKKHLNVKMECSAQSREELLLEFLNQLLTRSAVRRCVFTTFNVQMFKEDKNGASMKATVFGEKINGNNMKFLRLEVKGATYSQLKIYKKGSRTVAQCVVDV